MTKFEFDYKYISKEKAKEIEENEDMIVVNINENSLNNNNNKEYYISIKECDSKHNDIFQKLLSLYGPLIYKINILESKLKELEDEN